MSTDDPRTGVSSQAGPERGFTLLETMVTLIIIGLMATIAEHTLGSAQRTERQLAAVRLVTGRTEKIAYDILDEVRRSRKLFHGDAIGSAYLDALDLARDPLLPAARLPIFDEANALAVDTAGDPRTGNILFFVVEGDAAGAVADASVRAFRSIDLHRFVCVYPTQTTRVILADSQMFPARDLVMWRSALFPSYAQIMAIEDADQRESVVRDLVERWGCDYAWDSNADVDAAFYSLGALGAVATTPESSFVIDEDFDESERGRLVYANVQLARTRLVDYYRRPRFTVDDPATWAPDGFEIKIVGASGARKIWYRLTAESPATKQVVGVQSCEMTASPRDM